MHCQWFPELILSFLRQEEARCVMLMRESDTRSSHVLPFLLNLPASAHLALTLGIGLSSITQTQAFSQAGTEPWLLGLRHHCWFLGWSKTFRQKL